MTSKCAKHAGLLHPYLRTSRHKPRFWQKGSNVSVSPCLASLHFPFNLHSAARVMTLNMTYGCNDVLPSKEFINGSPRTHGNSSNSLAWLLPSSLCTSCHLSIPHKFFHFSVPCFLSQEPSLCLLFPPWPSLAPNSTPLPTWWTCSIILKFSLGITSSMESFPIHR